VNGREGFRGVEAAEDWVSGRILSCDLPWKVLSKIEKEDLLNVAA